MKEYIEVKVATIDAYINPKIHQQGQRRVKITEMFDAQGGQRRLEWREVKIT